MTKADVDHFKPLTQKEVEERWEKTKKNSLRTIVPFILSALIATVGTRVAVGTSQVEPPTASGQNSSEQPHRLYLPLILKTTVGTTGGGSRDSVISGPNSLIVGQSGIFTDTVNLPNNSRASIRGLSIFSAPVSNLDNFTRSSCFQATGANRLFGDNSVYCPIPLTFSQPGSYRVWSTVYDNGNGTTCYPSGLPASWISGLYVSCGPNASMNVSVQPK